MDQNKQEQINENMLNVLFLGVLVILLLRKSTFLKWKKPLCMDSVKTLCSQVFIELNGLKIDIEDQTLNLRTIFNVIFRSRCIVRQKQG